MKQLNDKIRHCFFEIRRWRIRRIPDMPFMFILAAIIGVMAGFGAHILKVLVKFISLHLTSNFNFSGLNYWFLLLPLLGIVLVSVYTRFILRKNITHGVELLIGNLRKGVSNMGAYTMYSPILAGAVTLGFGGSAGSEGPIAYAGAGMGGNVGKWFKIDKQFVTILIGCGAGAGIAGIFKAPIGGVLFTLEVLGMNLATVPVLALFVSAISAALTAYCLSGFTPDIVFVNTHSFDVAVLPYLLLLGIFCGFYSLYYNFILKKVEIFLKGLSSTVMRNLLAGGTLAVFIFLFPTLYGEGYGTVQQVINGHYTALTDGTLFSSVGQNVWVVILVAIGIMACKSCATAMTVSGGGVAGNFAPTLFAGCMAGFMFAFSLNTIFDMQLPVASFAFYAMAGVMTGVIRAPLMAIFLTVEMAASYSELLPVVIVASVSFGVVRLFTFDGFYTGHLDEADGLIIKR